MLSLTQQTYYYYYYYKNIQTDCNWKNEYYVIFLKYKDVLE